MSKNLHIKTFGQQSSLWKNPSLCKWGKRFAKQRVFRNMTFIKLKFCVLLLNIVDDIWGFRLYLCRKYFQCRRNSILKSPNSHANPSYTFAPSSKWGIFPQKGFSTKHTRKRSARNDREFSTALVTFSEKCSLATIKMNWRLTKIDFDLILNIQDTPVYCRVIN